MPSIRHIVVVGLMGAGKTTVGRRVADRLGWRFCDSDIDIEAATRRTVRELGDEIGVAAMHELEARQLLDALAEGGPPSVVAAAASTIEVEACRAALRRPDVAVVWLRAAPETLAARFASAPHRPAYGPDPARFLAEQAARRGPLFASLDPIALDVDGLAPDAVVDRALRGLAALGVGRPDGR